MKMIQLPGSQALGIDEFEMQTVPVTQELYAAVMKCNPSYFREEPSSGLNLPVECVSWLDAAKFCNHASRIQGLEPCYEISVNGEHVNWHKHCDGFRLPTEKEWERACRAGSDVDPTDQEILEQAWCQENSEGSTHSVATKQPNAWGLYDMLGNVREWCQDLWGANYSHRVLRGGGWSDYANSMRAAGRSYNAPSNQYYYIGFRCSRTIR